MQQYIYVFTNTLVYKVQSHTYSEVCETHITETARKLNHQSIYVSHFPQFLSARPQKLERAMTSWLVNFFTS